MRNWLSFFVVTTTAAKAAAAAYDGSDVGSKGNKNMGSCSLECANGGYCTLVEGTEQDLIKRTQSGNLIEVCVCRPGFTGLACESPADECRLPERTCHSQVPCTKQSGGEWGCNCAIEDSISDFAGRMCRKPITEYCTGQYDPDSALSFCTNGGRCKADYIAAKLAPGNTTVNKKYQHAGCHCPPEFDGPHCEFLRKNQNDEEEIPINVVQSYQIDVQSPATAILSAVLALSVLVLLLLLYFKRRWFVDDRNANFTSNGTYIENASNFSDDSEELEENMEEESLNWAPLSESRLPSVLETVVLE